MSTPSVRPILVTGATGKQGGAVVRALLKVGRPVRAEGLWEPLYWKNKAAVNEMVKTKGFRHWVILKPAMIMENLLPPMAWVMFPSLAERGRFETAIEPDTRLDWIAAQDIGAFAAAAFRAPQSLRLGSLDVKGNSMMFTGRAEGNC